ncbi:hypothetical protein FRC07_001006 [Ceratobasidium sp. 392]|nr:hypothetical protein FRC07_001006 [Ceratobasidium sp. 392]
MYTALYAPYSDLDPRPYNENTFNRSMQRYKTYESLRSIMCSDTAATDISLNAYTNYFRELGKLSPVGEQWPISPWTTAKGLKKTRFPILFLSLDADPVTPLSSAIKMSEGFGNESAVLLVQQGFGHCTTSHPSLCTYKRARDYFVEGKVPAPGAHCTPE